MFIPCYQIIVKPDHVFIRNDCPFLFLQSYAKTRYPFRWLYFDIRVLNQKGTEGFQEPQVIISRLRRVLPIKVYVIQKVIYKRSVELIDVCDGEFLYLIVQLYVSQIRTI